MIVNEKTNITPVGAMLISTRVRFSFCNTSLFNIIMDVLSYYEKMLVREKVRNKQMDNQVIKVRRMSLVISQPEGKKTAEIWWILRYHLPDSRRVNRL